MPNDLFDPSPVEIVGAAAGTTMPGVRKRGGATGRSLVPVTKAHNDIGGITELVQWMNLNFRTLGVVDALQQAAFMLCIDVISQDIAKATLQLKERLSNGTSKVVAPGKHPIAALLALEPNRRHTWYNFTEMLVIWQCITRNAFAGVIRDSFDAPVELIPFQSSRIFEKVNGREVFYDVVASTMQEMALLGSHQRTFSERDMIHSRSRMIDGMDGYSTLVAGQTTLTTGAAIEGFRNDLFGADGSIRGVFRKKGPGVLNDEAFQRLRTQLRTLLMRMKQDSSNPIVLEDDMEFQPIASKPQEMELSKQFQAQVLATCRLLRVPPHKVFEMEGIKYENLETSEKMYVGDTLIPVATPLEQQFGKILLTREERLKFFFEYDREDMVLRDSKVETERATKALERGAITFDEYRARLGYNPLPNGQGAMRIIPVNMVVVDEHGVVVIGPAPPAEAEPEEPESEPAVEPEP